MALHVEKLWSKVISVMARDRCEEIKIVFSLGRVNSIETISTSRSEIVLGKR